MTNAVILWMLFVAVHWIWSIALNKLPLRQLPALSWSQALASATAHLILVEWSASQPIAAVVWFALMGALYYANVLHHRFFSRLIGPELVLQFLTSRQLRGMNADILRKAARGLLEAKDLLPWLCTAGVIALAFLPGNVGWPPLVFWSALDVGLLLLAAAVWRNRRRGVTAGDSTAPYGLAAMYAFGAFARKAEPTTLREERRSAGAEGATGEIAKEHEEQPRHAARVEEPPPPENDSYFGSLKGKNLIMIQLESFQHFLIGQEVDGQEVTPFLNRLAREHLYFDDIFTQYGMGHTADAEFAALQSLLPLQNEVVHFKYFGNDFDGLPHQLKRRGYETAAYHGYKADYYNRRVMMRSLGFDSFQGEEDYFINEKISLGLSDESFFEQTVRKMKGLKEPFFSFVISLTSHFPFDLDSKYCRLQLPEKMPRLLRNYFQSVHYTDRALNSFIEQLRLEGLLESSLLVIYGDHEGITPEGIAQFHQYFGISSDHSADKQLYRGAISRRVPLLMASGTERERKPEVIQRCGGLIDIAPTALHLLGIAPSPQMMGQSLLAKRRFTPVPLSNLARGSFATDEWVYLSSTSAQFDNAVLFDRRTESSISVLSAGEDKFQELYQQTRQMVRQSREWLANNGRGQEPDNAVAEPVTPAVPIPDIWQRALPVIPKDSVVLMFPRSYETEYMEANLGNESGLRELGDTYTAAMKVRVQFLRLLELPLLSKPVVFNDTNYIPELRAHGYAVERLTGMTLEQYMRELPDHTLVVMAGQDDCSQAFNAPALETYRQIGMRSLEQQKHLHHSYVNILYKNGGFLSLYEEASDSPVHLSRRCGETLNGVVMPTDLEVRSAGFHCGNYSGILIGGESYSFNRRGLNMAALRADTGETIDKRRVDTFMTLYMDDTIYMAVKAGPDGGA